MKYKTFEDWAREVGIDTPEYHELHEHAYQMAKGAWLAARADRDPRTPLEWNPATGEVRPRTKDP